MFGPESFILVNFDAAPLYPDMYALRIDDGRITQVWGKAEWSPVAGIATIDLDGCTVLPGIDDSHLHGYEYGRSLTALVVDRETAPDLTAIQERLRTAQPETGGWIRGIGWDGTGIVGTGPGGTLCAADLDAARPDVPMLLADVTGHQAVCNSLALEYAGLTSESVEDPSGGSFVRMADGRPSGLLLEAAVAAVNKVMPKVTIAEKKKSILAGQQSLLAQGVTAFTDPGLGPGAATLMDGTGDLDAVRAYQELDAAGELHQRISLMLLYGGLGGTRADQVAEGLDEYGGPTSMEPFGHLAIDQVKVFADGIPRSRTAWMREPYDDCTHGHLQVAGATDDERVAELAAIVEAAASRGWQVGLHATGDLTVHHVVDVLTRNNAAEMRHYVIHGDFVAVDDLAIMSAHNITLNSNPSIRWAVGDSVSPVIGMERNARRQPLRTAWDLGVNVCASSDAPVAPPDWRLIAASAMTRAIRTDPARSDGQQLTGLETMLALTANGAWQGHQESWRGAILPGLAADLVVLDARVDWKEPWSLVSTGIRATIAGGRIVHGSL